MKKFSLCMLSQYTQQKHKVQICTKTINLPSKKVIEKCGFIYEGTLRDYFYDNGQYIGRLFFSILREEYEVGFGKDQNVYSQIGGVDVERTN